MTSMLRHEITKWVRGIELDKRPTLLYNVIFNLKEKLSKDNTNNTKFQNLRTTIWHFRN